jgi:hypothetical protein
MSRDTYHRAQTDCVQDSYENCPFASIGGLDKRVEMKAPDYIAEADRDEYLRGYRDQAKAMYGEEWQTCGFGWGPALTIPGNQEEAGKDG